MKLKPAIAAILSATALLASGGAFAESFSLGVLPVLPDPPASQIVPKPTGGFSDFFSFSVPVGWTMHGPPSSQSRGSRIWASSCSTGAPSWHPAASARAGWRP
jgi:hypothetical protein